VYDVRYRYDDIGARNFGNGELENLVS